MAESRAIPPRLVADPSIVVVALPEQTRLDRPDTSHSPACSQAIQEPRALGLAHVERVLR